MGKGKAVKEVDKAPGVRQSIGKPWRPNLSFDAGIWNTRRLVGRAPLISLTGIRISIRIRRLGGYPLFLAARKGSHDLVHKLLALGLRSGAYC